MSQNPLFTKERAGGVLFGILWRLAILVLPWQTRWFADASLGGWPWEQGRWSVYASMILMFATIILGRFLPLTKGETKRGSVRTVGILLFVLIVSLVTSLSITATLQWWIQVILLGGFVFELRRHSVSSTAICAWFVASLIPHACLGIWQYFVGDVLAMKWLGIAAHEAAALGTSVIEHDDVRILRAYGGFPHPNIFGGWLAMAMLAALSRVSYAATKFRVLLWCAALAVCSAAFVVTYARGAWIAFVVGLCILLACYVRGFLFDATRSMLPDFSWQFFGIALVTVASISGAVLFSQRDHVLARVDLSERLEKKSVDTRWQGLIDGWRVFRQHPLFGTGLNAELVAMSSSCKEKCPAPLEPPHNVPLLILEDLGIVGAVLLLLGAAMGFRRLRWSGMAFLSALFVIALFDHYPWSTWSGMCLVMLGILLCQNLLLSKERAG